MYLGVGRLAPSGLLNSGDQSTLREHNLGVVAGELFSAGIPLSRVELADRTGLTRATVARLVQDLIDGGIVQELEPARLPRRGRPATPVAPSTRRIAGVGVEMNVDYLAGRAIDLAGETLAEFRTQGKFADSDPAASLGRLGTLAAMMIDGLVQSGVMVAGVSVAIPGIVSADGRQLIVAPHLGWREITPVAMLEPALEKYGVPIRVANDANLQSICAASLGPGRLVPNPNFIYVSGATGIGGSVVLNGAVDLGQHGWAGEFGHMCIDPNGPPCFCGSSGCLERYVGMTAIMKAAGVESSGSGFEELFDALGSGNVRALEAVHRSAEILGLALASAINLLDVSRIVLGAGLGRLLPWMEPILSNELRRRVLGFDRRNLSVEAGASGPLPTCTGGALMLLHQLIADPFRWVGEHTSRVPAAQAVG